MRKAIHFEYWWQWDFWKQSIGFLQKNLCIRENICIPPFFGPPGFQKNIFQKIFPGLIYENSHYLKLLRWAINIQHLPNESSLRTSPSGVFLGKCVRKIYNKYAGEHPCRSVISIKLLRLVPVADKTRITLISQISDYNHTYNVYISSENLLLIFTPRNRSNNSYTKFT